MNWMTRSFDMEFEKAIKEIEKEYKFRWLNKNCIQIDSEQLLDAYNCCFVDVLNENGQALLTDFADHMQIITLPEEKVKEICKKHNITWNDYHLECNYASNQDIKNYFACLAEISENM